MSNKTLHILALVGGVLVLEMAGRALGAAEVRFMPVAADGYVICTPGEGACGETEIMLAQGAVEVTLFVQVSGWDTATPHPGDLNYFLGGCQGTLELATLEGGHDSGVDTMPGLNLAGVGAADGHAYDTSRP